jgi:hypothetical protein
MGGCVVKIAWKMRENWYNSMRFIISRTEANRGGSFAPEKSPCGGIMEESLD